MSSQLNRRTLARPCETAGLAWQPEPVPRTTLLPVKMRSGPAPTTTASAAGSAMSAIARAILALSGTAAS